MKRTARPERRNGTSEAPQEPHNAVAPLDQGAPPDIPAHVWRTLQEAGERAAERLRDILASPTFRSIPPTAQRALIELALTRAYGLPVRRSVAISLSTDDADAVAASLVSLRDALPERQHATPRPMRVVPDADPPDK